MRRDSRPDPAGGPPRPGAVAGPTVFVALLRAVNVGGTGTLPMATLTRLCEQAGLLRPRTVIASGNVVFESAASDREARAALEAELHAYAGRPVKVVVRTGAALERVLRANPFPATDPARTVVVFLDDAPAPDCLAAATGWNGEEARLGAREIYIHYGAGMARSKLRIPAAQDGTARNLNTVAKLAGLARQRLTRA